MNRALYCSVMLDRSPQQIGIRLVADREAGVATSVTAAPDHGAAADAEAVEPSSPGIDDVRRLLAAVEVAIAEAEVARIQSLDELQQLAVELSIMIAAELVGRAIDQDALDVSGLVREAVAQLGLAAPLTITLHPADVAQLESLGSTVGTSWLDENIRIEANPALPRGHCQATNGPRALLSEIGPRLESIRAALLEGLNDAQIERRHAAGLGTPLKRFPERRDIA